MIKSLYIKNVALIDEVKIVFSDNLNVFSGETGAGKSIIFDSIGLLLGARADKNIIKSGKPYCKVEGLFELGSLLCDDEIKSVLKDFNMEDEEYVSLSRICYSTGKSEYRLNGEMCTQHIFKKVSNKLLDIFGQHDSSQLLDVKNHIKFFDEYVGKSLLEWKEVLANYLSELKDINNKIQSLGGDEKQRVREIELLEYEIKQLEEADIKLGEDEELLSQKRLMLNSEKIYESLTNALNLISNNCDIVSLLKQSSVGLSSISGLDSSIDDIKSRIDSIRWESEDIVSTLESSVSKIAYDANALDKIEDRLDLINSFKRKYGNTTEEIINYYNNAIDRVELLKNCYIELENLRAYKYDLLKKMLEVSTELHNIRLSKLGAFENNVVKELVELGMKNSSFKVNVKFNDNIDLLEDNITINGLDDIEYYFSANLGEEVRSLSKIISGGELSRFCLAFRTIVNYGEGKTLIFDEIDAGIGGNTGIMIAKKLAKISRNNQVLCITHLAQIASFADSHFKIVKSEYDGATYTSILCLNESDKVSEISRMIGSINNDNFAFLHSSELLQEAQSYKVSLV